MLTARLPACLTGCALYRMCVSVGVCWWWVSLRESERAPRRARSHCCCLLRQSLCFQAHRRSSLARSLARTLSVKRNVTVNRNESSARKRESACACVCLLSQPLADADVDCAARVQLDFFQSWLGNRNRNNWNSSRRKFACVASISRAQQSQPTHPTTRLLHLSPHALLPSQVRQSLSLSLLLCFALCPLSAARFTCSRCLSWRRRQLVCSTSTTLPQTHCLCLCLYLCRRQQQRTAVINFYGFSPLDEAEADSNTAQPAACMARVIPSRNQKSVPLPVTVTRCRSRFANPIIDYVIDRLTCRRECC